MDEDDEPATTSFRVIVDGFERAVLATSWVDPTHLELDVEGVLAVTTSELQYNVTDPLFHTQTTLTVAIAPQVFIEQI